ncbi:hypothetical protein QFC20_007321 [Naganishia adeliensis]|uniref:Uncharacterized protein n=1 Tax=Naganishia adeliensis TaxID=92952 RepID=A0ACC2V0Q9_9TREE|nr:hypothetical protein QFC20_007321 [Naganishia adeliensis]
MHNETDASPLPPAYSPRHNWQDPAIDADTRLLFTVANVNVSFGGAAFEACSSGRTSIGRILVGIEPSSVDEHSRSTLFKLRVSDDVSGSSSPGGPATGLDKS